MKFIVKKFKGVIIFALIETFFFFKTNPNNLEAFFMIWGFIALIFLLYNIFNINADGSYSNLGGTSQGNYANMMGSLIEKEYQTEKSKKRSGGGLLDLMNLLYLLFLLVNVIGYIVVMPK